MSITHPCSQWNLQIKLPARGKIIASCQPNMSPKHYIKLYKQQKWTLKKSRLTSFKKCIFHAPQLPPQLLVGVGTELGGGEGGVATLPYLWPNILFSILQSKEDSYYYPSVSSRREPRGLVNWWADRHRLKEYTSCYLSFSFFPIYM